MVGPDRQTIPVPDHINARCRVVAIAHAMEPARRIDHACDYEVITTNSNGAVAHQVHRIQGWGGRSMPRWGRCRCRRNRRRSPWHIDQAQRAPLVQSTRDLGLCQFEGEAPVLYPGFDQIIDGAAGLKGLPEPSPRSVESQNRAIGGDHDQVIVERQSDAIEVDTTR
jgi:hypothetical protein